MIAETVTVVQLISYLVPGILEFHFGSLALVDLYTIIETLFNAAVEGEISQLEHYMVEKGLDRVSINYVLAGTLSKQRDTNWNILVPELKF